MGEDQHRPRPTGVDVVNGPSQQTGVEQARPEGSDTRTRISDAAASLFRRDGYSGTGLKRIAADSGAPFGSIYHFFPGGKEELAEHAIRTSGVAYGQLVMSLLDSVADPLESLQHAFEAAAADLEGTDYADACPIATVALEVASSNETLRLATADVFIIWVDAATDWFGRWVAEVATARRLAQSMIMMLEGGFLLSRALRDREPLLTAGRRGSPSPVRVVDARADELGDDNERHRGQHCSGGTQLTMTMATELHRVAGWGSSIGTEDRLSRD